MQATDLLTSFAIIGGLFVIWFIVVALFAPRIDYRLRARLDCTSKEFLRTLHTTCQAALHRHNRFEILTNASQFYPAMLAAIGNAQRSVNLECYIFRSDATGRQFMEALAERARAGVLVTLVVDAIGSFLFGFRAINELRRAGCRVELYQRFKWYRLARVNNRTHREMVIVDGCVGEPKELYETAQSRDQNSRIPAGDDPRQNIWSSTASGRSWARRTSTTGRSNTMTRSTWRCATKRSHAA